MVSAFKGVCSELIQNARREEANSDKHQSQQTKQEIVHRQSWYVNSTERDRKSLELCPSLLDTELLIVLEFRMGWSFALQSPHLKCDV